MKLPTVALTLAVAVAGCAGGTDEPAEAEGVSAAADVTVAVVYEGLTGPTQFVVDDDTFVVATINGGENEQLGQVLRIDRDSGEITELRTGLDKPTGVAVAADELWIMERDRLTRAPVDGDNAAVTVVADDLPNNGRSEGTLTVTPDGRILFNTSGSKRGSTVVEGSGRLFTVDPASRPGTPVELASGFKHAYAHTFDEGGTLWSTEMSDGRFDGEPAADEVVAVTAGADHGWPRCVGDNRAVAEFGGSAEVCASVPGSHALFAPGATPTSIAVSPFEDDTFLVALWNEGRIVAVDMTGNDPTAFDEIVSGLAGPQHLVAADDAVYVTEFGTGRILRLSER